MTTTTRNHYERQASQQTQAGNKESQPSTSEMHAGKQENGCWQNGYAGRQYAPYGNSIAQFEKYRKEH